MTSPFSACTLENSVLKKLSIVFKSLHSGERFRMAPFSVIVFGVVVCTIAVSGAKQLRFRLKTDQRGRGLGHKTLLFCRGRQRNAPRIITHVHSHCPAHSRFRLAAFRLPHGCRCRRGFLKLPRVSKYIQKTLNLLIFFFFFFFVD